MLAFSLPLLISVEDQPTDSPLCSKGHRITVQEKFIGLVVFLRNGGLNWIHDVSCWDNPGSLDSR